MLQNLLNQLDSVAYIILTVNLFLLIFASQILRLVYSEPDKVPSFSRKIMTFRALNLLIIVVYGYYLFYQSKDEQALGIKLVAVLAIIYLAYLLMHLVHFIIVRQYGKVRTIEGKERETPTHKTRLLSVFSSIFIAIIALIGTIHFLGLNSLLETGGVIGFIGVFLALTSSIWAPDIFHGIIILNSDMLSEGDVVELQDASSSPIIGIVYRTKIFHTVILNKVNNHRIMIRNSRLRDLIIHNLSKFASAKGLREKISFKIGYDSKVSDIECMFSEAYEKAKKDADISFERQYEMELAIDDTGDHAVVWSLYYYTKEVDELISIRQKMIKIVYKTSIEHNISLATPMTYMSIPVNNSPESKNMLQIQENTE